jgi:hypothetical protein
MCTAHNTKQMTSYYPGGDGKIIDRANRLTLARRAVMDAMDRWPLIARFGAAFLAVLAGLGLRLAFFGTLGEQSAYLTLFPAVAIAAIAGGSIGGALAALLSVMVVEMWVSPIDERLDLLKLAAFLGATHRQGDHSDRIRPALNGAGPDSRVRVHSGSGVEAEPVARTSASYDARSRQVSADS